MELKVENGNTQTASHLDLDLEINDGIFNNKLHFSVVIITHRQSNMPYKMFYSTISAEVLIICRATSIFFWFCRQCKEITKKNDQTRS